MPLNDMFSKKAKPAKSTSQNVYAAKRLKGLDDESGPAVESPIQGRKGPETSEEYRMRRGRRRPKTGE